MMFKSMSFALTVPNRTSILGKIFRYSHLSFTAAYSLKSEKNWPVSLTVFTAMCPEEQETSDNLIAKTTVLSLKNLINLALVVSLGDV